MRNLNPPHASQTILYAANLKPENAQLPNNTHRVEA